MGLSWQAESHPHPPAEAGRGKRVQTAPRSSWHGPSKGRGAEIRAPSAPRMGFPSTASLSSPPACHEGRARIPSWAGSLREGLWNGNKPAVPWQSHQTRRPPPGAAVGGMRGLGGGGAVQWGPWGHGGDLQGCPGDAQGMHEPGIGDTVGADMKKERMNMSPLPLGELPQAGCAG